MNLSPKQLERVMWLWPPYLGAGVKVEEFAHDGTSVVVSHRPNVLTKNALGTVFGGTMLTMTDPFYVLMGRARLGPDYVVWDVEADIRFIKQARGRVRARMSIDDATYDRILASTADGSKYVHEFETHLRDDEDVVVASVRRRVYFRRKNGDPA